MTLLIFYYRHNYHHVFFFRFVGIRICYFLLDAHCDYDDFSHDVDIFIVWLLLISLLVFAHRQKYVQQ